MHKYAIYYPYIRVPENAWFTRILLYWDQVGAIVPYEYFGSADRLGRYMVGLIGEGLVTQVILGAHLWRARSFTGAFIDYVKQKGRGVEVPDSKPWSRIHMEKLQDLGDTLCEYGLARKDPANAYSPWYEVEPTTADDFMAYLAAVLGQLTGPEEFYPITDHPSHLNPFLSESHHQTLDRQLRMVILEGILPAPSRALEPAQIAEFKAEHRLSAL